MRRLGVSNATARSRYCVIPESAGSSGVSSSPSRSSFFQLAGSSPDALYVNALSTAVTNKPLSHHMGSFHSF